MPVVNLLRQSRPEEGIGGSKPRNAPSPRLRGEGRGEGLLATTPPPQVAQDAAPHPVAALRAATDLSPQAGRGDWLRGQGFHRLASSGAHIPRFRPPRTTTTYG